MQIFIKPSNIENTKTMIFDVENMCTVRDIKQKIMDKFGIYNCKYTLMYEEKVLDDNMLLTHYNIENNCSIRLILSAIIKSNN
jgi:hypothetical protein